MFLISAENATIEVTSVNDEINYTIGYDVINGFDNEVSFEVTGNPNGSSIGFNVSMPVLINSKGVIELQISDITGDMAGEYELTLKGTSSSFTKEVRLNLKIIDGDQDQVLDEDDNCPLTANSEQRDFDGDGLGDICDNDINISKDIPKGFSPNNDGINDSWLIEKIGEIYPENKFQVFNKAGQLVYEKTPYDNSFDGVRNVGGSSKLPIGAYVYQLVTGDPVADFYPVGYVKKGWIYIKY